MMLSFRCAVKKLNTVEVPQNVKFIFTQSQKSDSFDKIEREDGLQPELLEREIKHSQITKYDYKELKLVWKAYLKSDVLCLADVYAGHALEMHKITGIGMKVSSTEARLGWKCFCSHNKDRDFHFQK